MKPRIGRVMTHEARLCVSMLPQCSTYPVPSPGNRCRATATALLFQPNGEPNPGGWICDAHGTAVVDEYAKKLGETWTLRPLHRYDAGRCAA